MLVNTASILVFVGTCGRLRAKVRFLKCFRIHGFRVLAVRCLELVLHGSWVEGWTSKGMALRDYGVLDFVRFGC